jgi:hypothetical protein
MAGVAVYGFCEVGIRGFWGYGGDGQGSARQEGKKRQWASESCMLRINGGRSNVGPAAANRYDAGWAEGSYGVRVYPGRIWCEEEELLDGEFLAHVAPRQDPSQQRTSKDRAGSLSAARHSIARPSSLARTE